MASWTSLPYELKLQIAQDFIDIILAQVPAFPIGLRPRKSAPAYGNYVCNQYIPHKKRQVWALFQVNTALQEDLSNYCQEEAKRASSKVWNPRLSSEKRMWFHTVACVARDVADDHSALLTREMTRLLEYLAGTV